jgi:hypothetical protein
VRHAMARPGTLLRLQSSWSERAVHASDVAFELSVEAMDSRGRDEFDERVKLRLEDRSADDAAAAGRRIRISVG